ncbi:ubiE/COQ5 methyltransferase family-domain-containing protein [Usnea florida]
MSTPPLPRTLTRLTRRLPLPHPPHRRLSCSRLLAHQQQPQYQDLPSQDGPPTSTTHFGFQTVPSSSKNSRVATVFSSVAASYDTMNDLMSLGIHRLWKDRFVRHIDPGIQNCGEIEAAEDQQGNNNNSNNQEGQTILDVAGGTGDIAFRMLKHCTAVKNDHVSKIIVADINPDMLAEGQRRARQAGHDHHHHSARLSWLEADAENLTAIADDSVDLYTVAFGIRNFTRKSQALREARRVLRPGGVFACLEFRGVGGDD